MSNWNSVLFEMSLEQDLTEVSSASSTMLKTFLEPLVPPSGGSGILKLGIKSFNEMVPSEEIFENNKKSKKLARHKESQVEDAVENLEIEIDESLEDNSAIENSQEPIEAENKKLRIISLDEIAWHDTPDDCWFAIYDYVYDCTSFIKDHPGGDDVLLEYAGRDATLAFIGAGHSKFAQKALERYLIGELPANERIFRIDGGVKVYGF